LKLQGHDRKEEIDEEAQSNCGGSLDHGAQVSVTFELIPGRPDLSQK